jgi:uncharacterized DUF497 family protein
LDIVAVVQLWNMNGMKQNVLLIFVNTASILSMFQPYLTAISYTVEDDRYDYGEQRFVTFGLLQGRVIAVVHIEREDCTRIISARKATKYEQRTYFEQLSN